MFIVLNPRFHDPLTVIRYGRSRVTVCLSRIVFLALITFLGTDHGSRIVPGQQVEVRAPWLTAYDHAGRPQWDVRVDRLWRTDDGWQGEKVEVRLFNNGEEELYLVASDIKTARRGRIWTLSGEVRGTGRGLSFSADLAQWENRLFLEGLVALGEGIKFSAAEARWAMGGSVELAHALAEVEGFIVEFESGRYDPEEKVLTAFHVHLVGQGLEIFGDALSITVGEGKLIIRGARVARTA